MGLLDRIAGLFSGDDQKQSTAVHSLDFRDQARGCLIGGAIGDALGYAVEFIKWKEIKRQYGEQGIQAYALSPHTGTAIISDDTQMTLYTANGLLLSEARGRQPVEKWIYEAYLDWLVTQQGGAKKYCWLNDIPQLHARRAPGITCLNALESGRMGWIADPINNSKGCGGVMRVAPVAIYGHVKGWDVETADRIGAAAAAITHGHSLGYLSGAALVDMIGSILDGATPRAAADIAADAVEQQFSEDAFAAELAGGMRKAVRLALVSGDDHAHLKQLGEGWVGEEALYVAIYCAVKYQDDFDRCMTVAVNHDGDSDSTGAIAGNILGAYVGYEAIDEKWKRDLELRDTILEVADDLCDPERGASWQKKYAE